jgi:hypothetical protein
MQRFWGCDADQIMVGDERVAQLKRSGQNFEEMNVGRWQREIASMYGAGTG